MVTGRARAHPPPRCCCGSGGRLHIVCKRSPAETTGSGIDGPPPLPSLLPWRSHGAGRTSPGRNGRKIRA
eukprot:15441263-Alexandrium_andersonii.AAC.1